MKKIYLCFDRLQFWNCSSFVNIRNHLTFQQITSQSHMYHHDLLGCHMIPNIDGAGAVPKSRFQKQSKYYAVQIKDASTLGSFFPDPDKGVEETFLW